MNERTPGDWQVKEWPGEVSDLHSNKRSGGVAGRATEASDGRRRKKE